jgi:hypothetical protein
MDVKELIESERKWLQNILDRFLAVGCYVDVFLLKYGKDEPSVPLFTENVSEPSVPSPADNADESSDPLFRATVSGLRVLRVAPKFDAAGDHTGSTFWVFWNGLGYDEGFQFSHTFIVTRIENTNDPILDLWGGEYHHRVGELFPDDSSEHADRFADLQTWRAYQAANADRFARLDAQLLEEHTEIANQWPSD